ncbi:MFS transporter [Goodfellowiella coeruleoviolacea]|uniref:Major Facilitator Superfamily protein n=1 Tax=Goodfellowiella coeruleoviolacea TaxID=334858 RepID=A0AAE3KHS1_9PSEU|nr:MFS transporter [Goodfellowiella coeruleoviolacea]MCP2166714.1 Major Facilitator Superfamily protein [Goodfellowiella coeruleoviolacea]
MALPSSTRSAPSKPTAARRNETGVVVAIAATVLAYALTQTMPVPTVNVLRQAFDTSAAATTWAVVSAPLLAGAVLTPVIGRLGDQFGKRRALLTVLAVFLAGSVTALVSWDIGVLIAARAVQGVSLAVMALGYGILRESLPADRVPFALGLTAGVLGGGAGGALVVGGLIVDHLPWRAMFLAGCLLVGTALVLVARYVPESRVRASGRPDLLGAGVLGLGLAALLLALTQAPAWGWTSPGVIALAAAGTVLFGLFIVVERRVAQPLVDPELFTHRPILMANLGALLLGISQYVFYLLVPTLAQLPAAPDAATATGFALSVTGAGLVMLPGSVATLPAGSVAGWMGGRLGPRAVLGLGLAVAVLGAAAMALGHDTAWQVAGLWVVFSIGSGLAMAALPALVSSAAPADRVASANGINVVARTVGGSVGSQLGIAVLASQTLPGTGTAAASAFGLSFWIAAGAAALGVLAAGLATSPAAG